MIHKNNKGNLVHLLRKWLGILLYVAIVGELVFFPSLPNLCGCAMALIVWLIFRTFFLKRNIILQHPFAFLMFLSMFLYRYLPLIATLIEGKPISYGFEVPYETFFYETLLFVVSSIAFAAAIYKKKKYNNVIQRTLYRLHFFKTESSTLWLLGLVGLVVRIQQLSVVDNVEYGDINNKFLAGLTFLQYAPVIMLFPTLCGMLHNKLRNTFVWIYVGVIFVVSFATNSRQAMIYPIFTIILLFFIYLLRHKISIYRLLSPAKIVFVGVVVVFGLGFVSDVSLAMLANRGIRTDVSSGKLFEKTVKTLQDEQTMNKLRSLTLEEPSQITSYRGGWDETYLDNFIMNRFANLRISDETIHYAIKVGYGNGKMQTHFWKQVLGIFPTNILNLIGVSLDKKDIAHSPGDYLYMLGSGNSSAIGGYRITSHTGDGLATFGLWYFSLQFVVYFIVYLLADCLVYYGKNGLVFSTLGLVNGYNLMLTILDNGGGIYCDLGFVIRGFWQMCFLWWVVNCFVRIFEVLIKRK